MARLGYNFNSVVSVSLDALNLFGAEVSQIDDFYVSRLPGEPAEGVADATPSPWSPPPSG